MGVLGVLELAPADLLERVSRGVALIAFLGAHPGAQLGRPELLVGQYGLAERVVGWRAHDVVRGLDNGRAVPPWR
jgi:hypothetical protein